MSSTSRFTVHLPFRARASLPRSTSIPFSKPQTRQASTARRHRKMLNLPPAPHAGGNPPAATQTSSTAASTQAGAAPAAIRDSLPRHGSSGRSRIPKSLLGQQLLAAGDRIVYAPPSSMANPVHTPLKFLPPDDPRRVHLERIAAMRTASLAASGTAAGRGVGGELLPPPTREPKESKYHLGPESIEEMRRLRRSDETKWTRGALAKKFNCSNMLVGLVVQASPERMRKLALEKKAREQSWGPKRRKARVDRQRRRALWSVDE